MGRVQPCSDQLVNVYGTLGRIPVLVFALRCIGKWETGLHMTWDQPTKDTFNVSIYFIRYSKLYYHTANRLNNKHMGNLKCWRRKRVSHNKIIFNPLYDQKYVFEIEWKAWEEDEFNTSNLKEVADYIARNLIEIRVHLSHVHYICTPYFSPHTHSNLELGLALHLSFNGHLSQLMFPSPYLLPPVKGGRNISSDWSIYGGVAKEIVMRER